MKFGNLYKERNETVFMKLTIKPGPYRWSKLVFNLFVDCHFALFFDSVCTVWCKTR